jgi:hypothetical protein
MVQQWLISRNNRYSNKENYTAMKWKQRKQFWSFAWKESRSRIVLAIVVSFTVAWLLHISGSDWWNSIEPVITFLTLAVAIFIGYQQMREEWEEDHLPKRLTALFYFNGKEVMRCENARLAGEADIRALTQQIGLQMNKLKENLKFAAPDVEVSPPVVSQNGDYVHYVAKVHLFELPSTLTAGKVRVWREPFIVDGNPSFEDVDDT